MFLAAPGFVSCISHAMVDSEVGVMMHGLPIVLGLLYGLPLIGASTILWGLGLRHARLGGEEISFGERWGFRGIAAALLIVVWGFSQDFVHRGMQWLGLRH